MVNAGAVCDSVTAASATSTARPSVKHVGSFIAVHTSYHSCPLLFPKMHSHFVQQGRLWPAFFQLQFDVSSSNSLRRVGLGTGSRPWEWTRESTILISTLAGIQWADKCRKVGHPHGEMQAEAELVTVRVPRQITHPGTTYLRRCGCLEVSDMPLSFDQEWRCEDGVALGKIVLHMIHTLIAGKVQHADLKSLAIHSPALRVQG